MSSADIGVGQVRVVPSHLQRTMSQLLLETERVAAVAQVVDATGVAKLVGMAPYPQHGGILSENRLDAVTRKGPPLHGQPEAVGSQRPGPVLHLILHQRLGHPHSEGHIALLAALAHDSEIAAVEVDIALSEPCQLAEPNRGIVKGEHDAVIAEALIVVLVRQAEHPLHFHFGEGNHHLLRHLGHAHASQGVGAEKALSHQVAEEGPDRPGIAVDAALRELLALRSIIGVLAILGRVAECVDEGPELAGANGLHFGVAAQEPHEVPHGVGDPFDGAGRPALRLGADTVGGKPVRQSGQSLLLHLVVYTRGGGFPVQIEAVFCKSSGCSLGASFGAEAGN